MKGKFLLSLLAIGILIMSFIFINREYKKSLIKKDPYDYLMKKGDAWELEAALDRINEVISKNEIDSLLIKIFTTSRRLDAITVALSFSVDHNLVELKPLIEERLEYFESLPLDSTWVVVTKKTKNKTIQSEYMLTQDFLNNFRAKLTNWN